MLLDLIETHYFPLKHNLIPCMPGLIIAILPSLEDSNEDLQKRVFGTLDKAMSCVGKKFFMGSIWMALLRCPKARLGGLKYLSRRIPRPESEVNDENQSSDTEEENFND